MKPIVLATGNPGKLKEVRAILGEAFDLRSLREFPGVPDVVENGRTFEENASKKAGEIACFTGEVALADDSGLEVDALDGAPGVRSARFSGPGASDARNNEKLLSLLECVPDEARTARFRCVIALARPGGPVETAEGVWEGRIARAPRGGNGFGYDPLFVATDQGCTAAELPADVKNAVSHRARALRAARPLIERTLA